MDTNEPDRAPDALFSPERRRALRDFWLVYDAHYEEMNEALREVARGNAAFARMMAETPPAELEAQRTRSRTLLYRAVEGDCAEFEADLREQGTIAAAVGLSFSSWFDLLRAHRALLVPALVHAYADDPPRLAAAIVAAQEVIDRAVELVGEAYLTRKEQLIARAKEVGSEARARADELELSNVKIREANRMKSEFLANMSHELRTPLNSIIGFAEVLHDGEVDPNAPEHREFVGDILRSGRHLLQLINDVLDLAKVEAGKLEFHPEQVDPRVVLDEVASLVRTTAATKNLGLATSVDPTLGPVFVDPGRLKQILYNYVSNALKFTQAGGKVAMKLEAEGADAFRIEVHDDGPGIAGEDLGRLFIEFEQLDGGLAKRHSGTGLGLSLTKRMVEAQGGTVGVRSEPGRGSVFFAVLPRKTTGRSLPEPRVIRAAGPRARTVLVVEDDPKDQDRIAATLVRAGYGVETSSTGAQAIRRCSEVKFDAVTLDLLLPDMSGLEVLAAIQSDGPSSKAAIVIVSVAAETATIGGFAVEGVIPKPVEPNALLGALRRAQVSPSSGGQVLVIDDDLTSLRLMQRTLSQLGYTVETCDDAQAGLQTVRRSPPDAIVLDLVMPQMNGFEFLTHLRADSRVRDVPVLVWSVKDLTTDEHLELRRSAQAVLAKGRGGTGELVDVLESVLRGSAHGS